MHVNHGLVENLDRVLGLADQVVEISSQQTAEAIEETHGERRSGEPCGTIAILLRSLRGSCGGILPSGGRDDGSSRSACLDIPSPASILRQPPHSGAEPLASCLRRLQPGHGPGGDPGLAELSRRWPQLVSTELASQSRPLALQGGSLLVAVNSPHWVQALQYSRQLLLGRLRAAGFPLRSIRLQC
ncbi:MAG: DUF721 domain-containing protein, partial [Aphanocapsa feldmannii 277cV]